MLSLPPSLHPCVCVCVCVCVRVCVRACVRAVLCCAVLVCYRLAFPNRIYYIYASTEEEVNDWVEILQWKLVSCSVCNWSSELGPP